MEIKRYKFLGDVDGNAYKEQDPNGEYYKVKDIEDLLKGRIEKLSIQNGDVLIISPLEGKRWSAEQSKNYMELVREVFQRNYDNIIILFTGDQTIEIKRAQV